LYRTAGGRTGIIFPPHFTLENVVYMYIYSGQYWKYFVTFAEDLLHKGPSHAEISCKQLQLYSVSAASCADILCKGLWDTLQPSIGGRNAGSVKHAAAFYGLQFRLSGGNHLHLVSSSGLAKRSPFFGLQLRLSRGNYLHLVSSSDLVRSSQFFCRHSKVHTHST
jgi:hypothetical protein